MIKTNWMNISLTIIIIFYNKFLIFNDLTINELNSYGCQTTNVMHDVALNINSLIMYFFMTCYLISFCKRIVSFMRMSLSIFLKYKL